MRQIVIFPALAYLMTFLPCYAQNVLTEIKDIRPKEIKVEGFRLDRKQDVEIEAIGFRPRKHGAVLSQAWILNAETRDLVWELEDANVSYKGRRLAEFDDKVSLPKGNYEVYYSTFPHGRYGRKDGLGDFIGRIFDEIFSKDEFEDYEDHRRDWKEFKIVVRGYGRRFKENEMGEFRNIFNKNAFVSMIGLRDDEYLQKGFKIEKPVDIQIYSLGEARRDGTFDYGWIMNTETHDKVWKFNYRDSEYAGGGKKNRYVDEIITLQPGRYVAFFVTDDSHSYLHWNDAPPYDPAFWGLTIKPENPEDSKYVKDYDFERVSEKNVIVKFDRLRDNEFRSEGFTCKKDLKVHIYAIGEGQRNEMFDYGWIVDASSHKKTWEMDFRNTEHAGGGDKNRLFDGVIKLDKGSYIVYFVTDGSHSYWDWNAAAPHDQENWGITLSAADADFKPGDISEYDEKRDSNILAKIVQVRDYEQERERFTLQKDSEIRIYAIGEGDHGAMYDYGWIEDANTRRVVWEMTYRRTEHAGGGKKNRLFDDTLLLRKGDYIVYYETDDSHSFSNWNTGQPYDPMNWGITIYLVDEK